LAGALATARVNVPLGGRWLVVGRRGGRDGGRASVGGGAATTHLPLTRQFALW